MCNLQHKIPSADAGKFLIYDIIKMILNIASRGMLEFWLNAYHMPLYDKSIKYSTAVSTTWNADRTTSLISPKNNIGVFHLLAGISCEDMFIVC